MRRHSTHRTRRRDRAPLPDPISLPSGYKFDAASGLQYNETTSAMVSSKNDSDWFHKSHLARKMSKGALAHSKRDDRGTRSLQDTVFEYMIENISRFSVDAIAFLPIPLVEKLWNSLWQRRGISFHIFAMFSAVLCKEATRVEMLRYQKQIDVPRSPFETYAIPLTSTSMQFLTILSITTPVKLVDLVRLSSIRNLTALEIVSPGRQANTAVDDRLVRAWSFAARDEAAFPVLRLLKLWNHEDITEHSLASIDNFPALAVYDVRGCNVNRSGSQSTNWRACMNKSILSLLEGMCVNHAKIALKKHEDKVSSMTKSAKLSSQQGQVRWMPRSEVSLLLATTENSRIVRSAHKSSIPKSSQTPLPTPKKKNSTSRSESSRPSWDTELYASLARISELQDDQDLIQHMSLGQQALFGSELINSYPVASFRLGPTPRCLDPDGLGLQYALAFVHVNLTSSPEFIEESRRFAKPAVDGTGISSVAAVRTKRAITSDLDSRVQSSMPEMTATSRTSESSQQPMKQRKTAVQRNKKKGLEDILKSYYIGT